MTTATDRSKTSKDFESTMSKLFRVPKSEVVTEKPKPPTRACFKNAS